MQHSASHSIHVDPVRKLIDLRISGLIAPEDAAWIGEELRAAIRTLGPEAGRHLTLYDLSGLRVMPAATVELVGRTFDHAAVRELWARKLAFVVTTALLRRQVRRLKEIRPDIELFDDRDAAIAWLLAD